MRENSAVAHTTEIPLSIFLKSLSCFIVHLANTICLSLAEGLKRHDNIWGFLRECRLANDQNIGPGRCVNSVWDLQCCRNAEEGTTTSERQEDETGGRWSGWEGTTHLD